MSVGIFDSGLGGLTVVNALPEESFIYVGDTARIPYGEKDIETLRSYGRQIIGFLLEKDVKAIIVACGTVSSNALSDLRQEFDLPIIDVIDPVVEATLKLNKKRIGVIATEATVKSGVFQKKLAGLEVDAKICPLFVPLIEEGWADHPITEQVVAAYLQDWQQNPVDAVILGCTHYPLLIPAIKKVLGDTPLIDMSVATVEHYLKSGKTSPGQKKEFYVSGDVEKFNKLGKQITGSDIKAKKICWQ